MNVRKYGRLAGFFAACGAFFVAACGAVGEEVSATGQAMTVSAGGNCEVRLRSLSYDDPGADDAEEIVLEVTGAEEGSTFADCGLSALMHVNGAAGDRCGAPIWTLALEEVEVGHEPLVTICTAEACDVQMESDGWLQNGPDGLVFVSTSGSQGPAVHWGSDAAGCFAGDSVELESEGPSGEGPDDLNVFCDGIPTLVLADDPRCPNELVDVAGGTSGGAAGADETPPAGTGDGLVADTAEPTSLETPETSSQDELSDENVGSVEYAGVNVVAPRPLAEDSYPVGTGNQQLVESVDVGPIPERDEESAGGDDGERVEEEKEAEPRPPRVGGCSLGGVATGDGGWWAFGIVALAVFCGRSARRGSRR